MSRDPRAVLAAQLDTLVFKLDRNNTFSRLESAFRLSRAHYHSPEDLRKTLGRKDHALIRRLAARAHTDKTVFDALCLALSPMLLRLAERAPESVNLLDLLWQVVAKPLKATGDPAKALEGRIRGRLWGWKKTETRRAELDQEYARAVQVEHEISPASDPDLCIDAQSTLDALRSSDRDVLVGSVVMGMTDAEIGAERDGGEEAGRAARRRALASARQAIERRPKKSV